MNSIVSSLAGDFRWSPQIEKGFSMNQILKSFPPHWQAGICLLVHSKFKEFPEVPTVNELLKNLGVSASSAYLGKEIIEKLLTFDSHDQQCNSRTNLLEFKIAIMEFELQNPNNRGEGRRNSFSYEYKEKVIEEKEKFGLSWEEVSKQLNIPLQTLKKFSRNKIKIDSPKELPQELLELINKYLQSKEIKRSVKEFFEKNKNMVEGLGFDYRSLCRLFLSLGVTSPNGMFKSKIFLDKIIKFNPHSIWGTDGKEITIVINGTIFKWVWQCLIDYKTTVIVGVLVSENENTKNLSESLKNAATKWGVSPLAIVMDNRLSENLPAIKEYLDKMGIQIIKTFPRNPKSNGITEGNFSIFEHYMGGEIIIQGSTEEDISKSIAQMLVEVFTQLRNNKPRGGFSKTPIENLEGSPDLSEQEIVSIREKLESIVNRFNNEGKTPLNQEKKKKAIEQALALLKPTSPDAFTKGLNHGRVSADLILQAMAIFEARKETNPDKKYGHAYFGGILNNLIDSNYLDILNSSLDKFYTENLKHIKEVNTNGTVNGMGFDPLGELLRLSKEFMEMKIPAFNSQLLTMIKEYFLITSKE